MSETAMDPAAVRAFLEAIHGRYGYDLRGYSPASIERRVGAAVVASGVDSLADLQARVLCEPELFASVLADLTVPATAMFRDPDVYRALRGRVIPIVAEHPRPKIWHAGCATGEEVFSNAILLHEEGLYERSTIFATDLSRRSVAIAEQGLYEADRLPQFAADYIAAGGVASLSAYYTAAYDRIALREDLAKNVCFFQHDLVTDDVFGEMQIVFCRNVLMYFGVKLRDEVALKLARALSPGGFLCLGREERLPAIVRRSFTDVAGSVGIYRYEGHL